MPAEQAAEEAGVIAPTQAEPPASAGNEQLPLTYSLEKVMDKLGVEKDVQADIAKRHKPKTVNEEVPAETEIPAKTSEDDVKLPEETEVPEEGEEAPVEELPRAAQKTVKKLLKRIDKLTGTLRPTEAERDELKSVNEQLRTALSNSDPIVVAPSSADPLSVIYHPQQLREVYERAELMKNWAFENGDGVILNEGLDNERIIDKREMKRYYREADDLLTKLIPRKQQQIQSRNYYSKIAKEINPGVFDRTSDKHKAAVAALSELPDLAKHPARDVFIAHYMNGVDAWLEKQGKNGNGQKPANPDLDERFNRKVPPIAEHTANPPSRSHMPNSRKKIEEADKKVIESGGSMQSLAAAIKARKEAGLSPGKKELVKV